LLVHPDHPLARCTRVRFEQTLDYDFVGLPSNSAVPLMLQRAAAELGKTMRLRVVVTSLDAVQRVVGANLAISVIPREVVAPHADQRLLQLVDLQEDWVERRFAIYFRDEKALSPAAALLVAHLQACARQQA
jgi:DNA-binding transcriptional LysR family regulator